MYHIERGVGRKLLFVHGLGGSCQSWSTVLETPSADRTVIAIDLPGHGATPAEADSGTFDGLVGSVERYIAENALGGIDIVSSSMGARIMLETDVDCFMGRNGFDDATLFYKIGAVPRVDIAYAQKIITR